MDMKTIIYLAVCMLTAFIVIVDSFQFGLVGILIIILALVAMFAILLLAFADFLIVPFIANTLKITIVPVKNYIMTSNLDAIIKYSNGVYYATGYLTANIYNYVFTQEQQTEDEADLVSAPDKWEKAVMNIHFPFKFNVIAASEEIQNYRDELETKRGLLEFQYSKEMQATNPNQMSIEAIRRQISVIQTRIDKIGEGQKPLVNIMYIETTAVGVSPKEASDNLTNQLNELQTIFNVFDLSITRIVGRELYLLFKMNYAIPSLEDLTNDFNIQK